jgi:ABC-type sugar transport system ATPase subunit
MTVKHNISLAFLKKLRNGLFINKKRERQLSDDYIKRLSIKTPSAEQILLNLSGGNQQKVVLAKWLCTKPKLLILDEPTRGVDVGAKKEIHALIDSLAKTGMAIMVISSELPEVLGISDRIIVMHNGELKCELSRGEASQEKILQVAIAG